MAKNNETLECTCGTEENHISRVDQNGETVIECSECKRFLKFPPQDQTVYQGAVKEEDTVDTDNAVRENTLLGN